MQIRLPRASIINFLFVLLFLATTTILLITYNKQHAENYYNRILKTIQQPQIYPKQTEIDVADEIPNLPIVYWNQTRKYAMKYNKTCASLPNIFNINFNNDYWQTLITSNGTFYLYNAYLDIRNEKNPIVRILSMVDRIELNVTTHCQFWYEKTAKPIIVKAYEYKYIWIKQWGNYKQNILQPYIISCSLPNFTKKYPKVVTLVENPCDTSTVSLNVIYNKAKEKKDFAVCVKGLDFPNLDLTVRLTEWIELLNILGADKIYFYDFGVHPNVSNLLNYYTLKGKVHVTPHKLCGGQTNLVNFRHLYLKNRLLNKRQNELIPYNDCFYKHMYEYKYVALLDIDEVIMPVVNNSWKELMEEVEKISKMPRGQQHSSFRVQNVYFLDDQVHQHTWFDDIPQYMHMLQHVYRAENFTKPGFYVKSFFNTNNTLGLHNHNPFHCLTPCTPYSIDKSLAQLQHYRSDCVNELKQSCDDFRKHSVEDTTIWKFKDELIARVTKTLDDLHMLEEDFTENSINEK